jgi:hypothetical protein
MSGIPVSRFEFPQPCAKFPQTRAKFPQRFPEISLSAAVGRARRSANSCARSVGWRPRAISRGGQTGMIFPQLREFGSGARPLTAADRRPRHPRYSQSRALPVLVRHRGNSGRAEPLFPPKSRIRVSTECDLTMFSLIPNFCLGATAPVPQKRRQQHHRRGGQRGSGRRTGGNRPHQFAVI